MKKVRKAIIPAAGLGTRLLPATKALPKELLPIINVPTLQYIVEEAIDSGIEEIYIIISRDKTAIKDYFSVNRKLENRLTNTKKDDLLKLVEDTKSDIKIRFIYQFVQKGLGDAIYRAKLFTRREPIAVLLGDDVVIGKGKTALGQCIDAYNRTGCSIVGVQPVEQKFVRKYGIIKPSKKANVNDSVFMVNDLVEKPLAKDAPSNLAILGRYVLTHDVFKAIAKTKKDKSGEIQLTNALKTLAKKNRVAACNFKGSHYDLGNRLGMVQATIDFALADRRLKSDVLKFIKSRAKIKK